jgi:hypothetical protein
MFETDFDVAFVMKRSTKNYLMSSEDHSLVFLW